MSPISSVVTLVLSHSRTFRLSRSEKGNNPKLRKACVTPKGIHDFATEVLSLHLPQGEEKNMVAVLAKKNWTFYHGRLIFGHFLLTWNKFWTKISDTLLETWLISVKLRLENPFSNSPRTVSVGHETSCKSADRAHVGKNRVARCGHHRVSETGSQLTNSSLRLIILTEGLNGVVAFTVNG